MRQAIKIFTLLLFFGSCKNNSTSNLILIDTSQTYPESDLRLSDVADVKYIPLKFGPDSTIFVNPGTMSVALFRDTIFVLNWKPPMSQIILYDTLGNPLRKIDRQGRGPQEYVLLKSWVVDTLNREIYGWDKELMKLLVYDFNGEFKREKKLNHSYEKMIFLNSNLLLAYNNESQRANPFMEGKIKDTGHKTITFIGKENFSEEASDFDYDRPATIEEFGLMENLTITKNGIYISSARSDTVYFMDRQCNLTPRIVDMTPCSGRRTSVIRPSIETERYLFLTKEYLRSFLEKTFPSQQDYYVYDKVKKQLFQLKKDLSRTKGVNDNLLQLFQDYIAIYQFTASQNHNYATLFLTPDRLQQNYDLLPPRLKAIADTLNDMDNPVLMLIKFR